MTCLLLIDRAFLIGQWLSIAVITYFDYCFCFYINIDFVLIYYFKNDLWQFEQIPYTSKIASIKKLANQQKEIQIQERDQYKGVNNNSETFDQDELTPPLFFLNSKPSRSQ